MKERKRNRGFTLVELMITIAIVAIVTTAATGFMVTSSKSFAKASADTNLQKEAELTVNQIQDMIIDTNAGMQVDIDEDVSTELDMYHAWRDKDETGAEVIKYRKDSVVWKVAEDKMYYSSYNVSYDGTGFVVDDTLADNELLAENVKQFEVSVDTEDMPNSDGTVTPVVRSVQIKIGYENSFGRVDYATSPIITLRNRLYLSDDPDLIFDVPPEVDANFKLYYKESTNTGEPLTITPIIVNSSKVERGWAYNIRAMLDGEGTDISNLVTWKIEETDCLSTIDANTGILTVHASEPRDYLSVTATYKTNPAKKKTGVLLVEGGSGKSFKKITILTYSLNPQGEYNAFYGSAPTFEGLWTAEERANLTYKWEVTDHPDWVEFVDGDSQDKLKLKLKPNIAKDHDGEYFEIKLTAHSNVTGETRVDMIKYKVARDIFGGDSFMRRGLGVYGDDIPDQDENINFWFDTNEDFDHDILLENIEYYFCDENGNRISAYDEYLDSVRVNCGFENSSNHHFYYTLTYGEDLPMDMEFYVMVIAHMKDTVNDTPRTYQRMFYIPAVSFYDLYHTSLTSSAFYAGFSFVFEVEGYYNVVLMNHAADVLGFELTNLDYDVVRTQENGQPDIDKSSVKLDFIFDGTHTDNTYSGGSRNVSVMKTEGYVNIDYNGQTSLPYYYTLDIKSFTVKVYMKEYPNVYTYITVYNDNLIS